MGKGRERRVGVEMFRVAVFREKGYMLTRHSLSGGRAARRERDMCILSAR